MKRMFLSFRAEDKKQVDGLRLLAANPRFDIEFYDESVRDAIDSTNAEYIKRKIREKIGRTSVTVCLLNSETYTSPWVAWELEESYGKGNTVIFMGLPRVSGSLRVPEPGRRRSPGWYLWDVNALSQMIENAR